MLTLKGWVSVIAAFLLVYTSQPIYAFDQFQDQGFQTEEIETEAAQNNEGDFAARTVEEDDGPPPPPTPVTPISDWIPVLLVVGGYYGIKKLKHKRA